MIFDRHPEYREKYNQHFWSEGYYRETAGDVNEKNIKKYIDEQCERDRMEKIRESNKKMPLLDGIAILALEELYIQTTSKAGG